MVSFQSSFSVAVGKSEYSCKDFPDNPLHNPLPKNIKFIIIKKLIEKLG